MWGTRRWVGIDESVAAAEDGERAKGFEAGGGVGQPGVAGGEKASAGAGQSFLGASETALRGCESRGWSLQAEAVGENLEAHGGGSEAAADGGFGAVGEVVYLLFATIERVAKAV